MTRPIALVVLLLATGAVTVSGCAGDTKYSQTELNALQVREFDAPYDAAFAAVVDAVFDAGYAVTSSDKRGGLITAQKQFGTGVQIKIDTAGQQRTAVRVSTLYGGQQQIDKARTDEFFRLIQARLDARSPSPPAPGSGR